MAKRRRTSAAYRKKRIGRFTVLGVLVLGLVLCATLSYKRSGLKTQEKEYSRQIAELKKEKRKQRKGQRNLKNTKSM